MQKSIITIIIQLQLSPTLKELLLLIFKIEISIIQNHMKSYEKKRAYNSKVEYTLDKRGVGSSSLPRLTSNLICCQDLKIS
jgi:hypothetical protein